MVTGLLGGQKPRNWLSGKLTGRQKVTGRAKNVAIWPNTGLLEKILIFEHILRIFKKIFAGKILS